jgi:translocation and assembly module TamB
MRALRYIPLTLIALLMLVVISALLLASRPDGFRWLAATAPRYVPGELAIQAPSGDLLNGIAAARVTYRNDSLAIAAEAPAVRLSLPALAIGLVRLNELRIQRLDIEALEAGESSPTPPEFQLPLALEIRASSIAELNWISGSETERIADISFSGAMRDERLRADQLKLVVRDVALTASGTVRFTDDWPLRLKLSWSLVSDPTISGSGGAEGSLEQLKLMQTLRIPDALKLNAQLNDLWVERRFDAMLVSPANQTIKIADVTLADIEARLSGTLDEFDFAASGTLETRQLPDRIRFRSNGTGNPALVSIASLSAETLGGALELKGTLALEDLALAANLTATNLNLTPFDPRLPDDFGAEARVMGQLPDRIKADFATLSGSLADVALTGSGGLEWDTDSLRAMQFAINAGSNAARLDGQLWPQLAANFALNLPEPELLTPDAAGRLIATGRVSGSQAAPEITLSARGDDLSYAGNQLASLSLDAQITPAGSVDISAAARKLSIANQQVDSIDLDIDGEFEAFNLNAQLVRAADTLKLSGNGSYASERVRVTVSSGILEGAQLGIWTLAEPLGIEAAPATGNLTFSAHCWVNAPAQLCADLGRLGSEFAIDARLTQLPVSRIPGNNQLGRSIAGEINAELSVAGTPGAPSADASLTLSGFEVTTADPDEPEETLTFRLTSAEAQLQLRDQRLQLTVRADGPDAASLHVSGEAGWPLADSTPIDGTARASVTNLAQFEPLLYRYAGVSNPTGELTALLNVSGTAGAPILSGTASVSNATLAVPQAGIEVYAIDIQLSGNGTEPLKLTASAKSGEGELTLKGSLDWQGETPRASGRLTGERFLLLRFPNQEALASPDLNIAITPQLVSISGRIDIPEADIRVEQLPQSAIRPSGDAMVKRERIARGKRTTGPATQLDLQVSLGENVELAAFGLDTGLRGNLRLTQAANESRILADGNLRSVDGKFEAYNRELIIERGTLVFSGPIEQPLVDVRAVRSVTYEGRAVTVGVLLTGPIANMRTRVFGEPAMSESDALSYLVLNRPLQRSETLDNSELSAAALALGLSSLLPVTSGVTSRLGIDEVSIDSTSDGDTALVAGKRLSDDFYIRYAYGLFDRIGAFVVRYEIGRGFSLEAGSGQEQTIDLLYSIDR